MPITVLDIGKVAASCWLPVALLTPERPVRLEFDVPLMPMATRTLTGVALLLHAEVTTLATIGLVIDLLTCPTSTSTCALVLPTACLKVVLVYA